MYDPYKDFKRFTLPNGVTVYHYYADRPWVMLRANVHVGWKDDPVGQSGLAHFVEHLVSKNIEGHDYQETRDFFKRNGDPVNFGVTFYECTQYGFRIIYNETNFAKALDIFGLMLLGAKLENQVDLQRSVINREFYRDHTPRHGVDWRMEVCRSMFKGHFLENHTTGLGIPEHFMAITKQSLQDFYDKYYVPSNISIVVCGGIEREDLEKRLRDSMLGMLGNNLGGRNGLPETPWKIVRPETNLIIKHLSDVHKDKVEQTTYTATWALPTSLREENVGITTRVLRHLLMKEIREKLGGTYDVSVNYAWWQDMMSLSIQTKVGESMTDSVDIMVRKCIDDLRMSQDVFDLEKESRLIRYSLIEHWPRKICDVAIKDIGKHQRIVTLMEDLRDDMALTHEDMCVVADHLSVEQQCTLIITP